MKNYQVILKGNKYYESLRQQRKDLRSSIVKDLLRDCNQALEKTWCENNTDKLMQYSMEGRLALYAFNCNYKKLDDEKLVSTHEEFYTHIYDYQQILDYNQYPDSKLNKQLSSSDMLSEVSYRLKRLEALAEYVEFVFNKFKSFSEVESISVVPKDEHTFDITFDSHNNIRVDHIGKLVAYFGDKNKPVIKTNSSWKQTRISNRSIVNNKSLNDHLYSITHLDPTDLSNATDEAIVEY